MDPVTAAIIAGVAAGGNAVASQVVKDAYEGLKGLIRAHLGSNSEVAQAVEKLEQRPESEPRQGALQEEVLLAKADANLEIVEAAQKLMELLATTPGAATSVQLAQGKHIAQASQGGTASVNVVRNGGADDAPDR